MSRVRCGTNSGWTKHKNAGEKPCDACVAAKAAYDKRRRSAPEQRVKDRARAKAQGRALMELKNNHPEEYRALYRWHRDVVMEELGLED